MRKDERAAPAATKHACPVLHEDAFYGLAGRIVRAIEPHTEASVSALLLQFLVAFGFCVGRSAYYLVDGARHYANLFVILVGDTSKARKGTSWCRIRELFELVPGWPRERVTTGLSSGEGLIDQVGDSMPDKRLLVVQTEFDSVLQVMIRSGNTLSPVVRNAWDGGELRVMTRNDPVSESEAHIAIIAHTTAEELLRRLESTDLWNGFANRFLWCAVTRARLLPLGGNLDESVIRQLRTEICKAVSWAHRLKGKQIAWATEAMSEWNRVYTRLARATPGLVGAVTSRAEAQVVRLALIYALLDKSREIRTEHLRAAMAVWKFCDESAREVFGRGTGDLLADRILEALKNSNDGMTRTEISALFKGHRTSDEIRRALDLLKELEFAECRKEQGTGRSIERWFVTK